MTIAEQLPLAFEIRCASFCPRLLAPLRANIDRFQAEARAALDGMDEDCKGTMAWDSCGEAIEHLELDWLLGIRADIGDSIWDATRRRQGYDTWSAEALRRHIADLTRLQDALTSLIATLEHLHRREAAELAATFEGAA